MEKLALIFRTFLSVIVVSAQEPPAPEAGTPRKAGPGFSRQSLQATVFLGGAAVINAADPDFGKGAGLRWSANINPIARLNPIGEYVSHGIYFDLQTLNLKALVTFGNPFFYGMGLYLSPSSTWTRNTVGTT